MLYAAYGSNMNLNQMKYRCPDSKAVGTGFVLNHRLVFKYHADIVEDYSSIVPVVLFEIDDNDWYMLDRYEGYPTYYTKKIVEVSTNEGTIECIVYVMTEKKGTDYSMPSRVYYDGITKGYIENGLFGYINYLYQALHTSFIMGGSVIE